ncbi:MAG: M48 family metalloprotease [Candidatus Altimarinota bacterium]
MYATCVPGYHDFAAVYSDLIDGCLKNNDHKTLKMVLGHELGHIRYNHVK